MYEITKKHVRDIAILTAIAVILGTYLIITSVIISKDGVVYIDRAQKLSTQTHKVMNLSDPFGFPVLIAAFHKFLRLDDSPASWILSGQIGVLTCRVIAIAVLYLFGTALFSRTQAFWAVLILICLPWPAEFGVDILREWPHLLFLFTGLLLLYYGIQKKNAVCFFAAGIVCSLGYIIRSECAQIILYGLIFFFAKLTEAARAQKLLRHNLTYACLLIGFLLIFIPYAVHLDNPIPRKLQDLSPRTDAPDSAVMLSDTVMEWTASLDVAGVFQAAVDLFSHIVENLMYYFALPAAIGFYLLFLNVPGRFDNRRLLVALFMGFYVTALFVLDMRWGYISRRHALPLSIMFCFYIPAGIRQIACWLNRKSATTETSLRQWSLILTAVGILICLPKLLKPMGYDKKGYRNATAWIAENTPANALFCTFDSRIPFYAGRRYRIYKDPKKFRLTPKIDYIITQSKNGQIDIPVSEDVRLEKTFELNVSGEKQVLLFGRVR